MALYNVPRISLSEPVCGWSAPSAPSAIAIARCRRADFADPEGVAAGRELRVPGRHGESVGPRHVRHHRDLFPRARPDLVVEQGHNGAGRIEDADDQIDSTLIDRERSVFP